MGKKISVAMATYQGEKYLPVQIDSILSQLGAEDELIISYDKSADRTLQILEAYQAKDARVKIFHNTVPGVTGNFNNAIAHCSGDFIYISDQDDKWADNKVVIVQKTFRETGADLVIHNGIHTNENMEPIGVPFFQLFRIGDGVIQNIMKPRMSGCCMAFTRKMKDVIMPMPEIRGYDQWIALVCELWGNIAYPEDILIYHRLHGNNVTAGTPRPLPVILRMRARLLFFLFARWLREVTRRKS
ncbi:MAG: glycosyltransferase [Eubacteriales bacterium]|nr:glycosyltransferase [Eubacteriales bacterium]